MLWLGQQLDQAEADFAAALERKAKCRTAAELAYPQPPEEIAFRPGHHPPAWCGVRDECDVDGKTVYRKDQHFRTTAWKIADADQLEDYLELANKRTKAAKEARHLLRIAKQYEADIEQAIEETGYRAAFYNVDRLARRIDRIAIAIYNCRCHTYQGVAIKALALLVAVKADVVDDYIAHRSKVLYATKLADDVVRLNRVRPRTIGLGVTDRKGGEHAA